MGMDPAPMFVFLYTVCGLFGSGLAISSNIMLSSVLSSEVCVTTIPLSFVTPRQVAAALSLTFRLSDLDARQGLKSRALPKICPMIVYFQYLSAFLQLLTLFNHIGYLANFYQRLTSVYPADEAWYTALIITQMVRR